MKLHVKYDINVCCKMILKDQLDKLQLPYVLTGLGEIEIIDTVSIDQYNELETSLNKYGIEIIDNPKNVFTQKIKDAIVEMVYLDEAFPTTTYSAHLADKLNKSIHTINNQRKNMMQKTKTDNLFQLLTYAIKSNLISLSLCISFI